MSFKIFPDILKQIESLSDKEREKIHVLFTELGPAWQELIGEQWFETLFSSKGIHR